MSGRIDCRLDRGDYLKRIRIDLDVVEKIND